MEVLALTRRAMPDKSTRRHPLRHPQGAGVAQEVPCSPPSLDDTNQHPRCGETQLLGIGASAAPSAYMDGSLSPQKTFVLFAIDRT